MSWLRRLWSVLRHSHLNREIERLWQDVRHGTRVFARHPGLTTIAVLSIALGTGANVAMFSSLDAHLLRPLPVARASEIVTVGSRVHSGPIVRSMASYRDYLDIRSRTRTLDGLIALDYDTVGVATTQAAVPRVRFATFVSANFFHVLGIEPVLGRGFAAVEDDVARPSHVVVLGDAFWKAEFGADPKVVGRTMRISGRDYTIVGVAPASFTGLHSYIRDALFLPIAVAPEAAEIPRSDVLTARDARLFTLKGRVRAGVSLDQVQAELTTIGQDLERAFPETNTNIALVVETEIQFKSESRPLDTDLLMVMVTLAVGVLCVACANVAGLLASRGPLRAREMALRLAIGASRARLVRQLLTESLGIALVGGAGGIAIGHLGITLLRQIQYPTDLIAQPVYQLDERALFFGLAVATVTSLVVGLGPALQTTRVDLTTSLKSAERPAPRGRRISGRAMLVALQVALSLVLLTISVYAVQVFSRELVNGPGFRTTQLAKLTIDPGQAGYRNPDVSRFFTQVLNAARQVPGVHAASLTSTMPLFGWQFTTVVPDGQAILPGQDLVPIWTSSIDDGYFDTLNIGWVAGRRFLTTDSSGRPPVAIINDTLGRRLFPNDTPVGKRLQVLDEPRTIVEIVGVSSTTTVGYPGELPQPAIFFPYWQRPRGQMVLLAHTTGTSASMLEPLRALVHRFDRDVPILDAQTIELYYETRMTSVGKVLLRLIAGMGAMGMGLTMIGLYGLVSYSVSRRTREIGIRIAVGATYARIVGMVLQEGMQPAWMGLAAGLLLSTVTAVILGGAIPLRQELDPRAFYAAVPIVAIVTLAAAFLPARRAARVNPTEALRAE